MTTPDVHTSVKDRLARHGDFIDVAILRHGFAAHMRDYDVLFEAQWNHSADSPGTGTYRLRFSHCPEAATTTAVDDEGWVESWSDIYADHARWIEAGMPPGFVWGTAWSMSYPGLTYVDDSPVAASWTERLGHPMHEVRIETEAFTIGIVFHDFSVTKLSSEVDAIDKAFLPLKPWEPPAPE